MAVRTPKSAPSGNPPRSGSAATLRTEKASGTYARRLSMVWTYRNDPRCHWLRSRRPQGIGTESVYAACLLYLFLATISRLTPPYLRNPTAEAGLVRSLRQGGFFWGGLRSVNAALPRTLRQPVVCSDSENRRSVKQGMAALFFSGPKAGFRFVPACAASVLPRAVQPKAAGDLRDVVFDVIHAAARLDRLLVFGTGGRLLPSKLAEPDSSGLLLVA